MASVFKAQFPCSGRISVSIRVAQPGASIRSLARRLIILLFAAAVWGLHEEDVKKRLRGLRPNAQLLQCPVCDRQKVVFSGATRVCRGHLMRRHPEEQMILLGQQG